MKPAVLFDLGNTLAAYYRPDQFQPILEVAIADLLRELDGQGLARVAFHDACSRAIAENREATDYRFTPMAERLERIFRIPLAEDEVLARELCEIFLKPIFAVGRLYEDSLSALEWLRRAGHPVAIVSNAPWGSPPELWRREIVRLGLASVVDHVVLCGDVGWRKPARAIFEFAAAAARRRCADCIFVGDDLRWDVAGSRDAGMRPIFIDREGREPGHPGARIENLNSLPEIVDTVV